MSRLQQEIDEQPADIARFVDRQSDTAARIGRELRDVSSVQMVARGSSDNAARYGQYLFGAVAGKTVSLAAPSLTTAYGAPMEYRGQAVVGISQSGQSPDVVAVVREARLQGVPTVAITNETSSPLAEAASHVLDLQVGEELSVAATKTYTTSLVALASIAIGIGTDPTLVDDLRRLPDAMRETLASAHHPRPELEDFAGQHRMLTVSRGFNYCTAFEIALKVKELARIVTEPYSAADLVHGPIAAVEQDLPVLIVAPSGPLYASLVDVARALRERGARTMAITDVPELAAEVDAVLPFPQVPERITPVMAVLHGQVVAARLAALRGFDADQPSGLNKITRTT